MSTFNRFMLAGFSMMASVAAASAATPSQIPAERFYGLYQQQDVARTGQRPMSFKAPHNGFDLRGNGVNPPIGPVTD